MSADRESSRERTLELDRLVNFSDGVFAIAATLLVVTIGFSLHLKQPDLDRKLWREFGDVLPQILAYALSFFIIARNWLGHHRMFKIIRRIDGRLIALNLAVLGLIALVPFPTDVYGNYPQERPALIVYCVAGQPSDRRVHPARVGDPLTAAVAQHPDRVPDLDPDLVRRRRPGAAVVDLDDPAADLLHAPLRQDHRRLGVTVSSSRQAG
jgi:hypothetical protein